MSGSTAARKEVSEWLKRQTDEAGDGVGRVEIDYVKEDERRIGLKAAGGEAFSVTYQTDYPVSAEEYLFLETESKVADFVAVINDLRDFVYGQPPSLSLTAVLDQLKRYLEKKSAKKGKGAISNTRGASARSRSCSGRELDGVGGGWSDAGAGAGSDFADAEDEGGDGGASDEEGDGDGEDDGNESDYVYEDDDDDAGGGAGRGDAPQMGSTWLDEHYKKRSWQSKERELREEMAASKERKAKEDAKNNKGAPKAKQVENIFTSKASSAVLTQDLLDIQRLEQELGMEVEAVDDNIFHWKVKINRVSDSSPLCEDLVQLRSKFAYGYVEMELMFTMDLYPFYPPLVKLIRPRFEGFMMGRITSLEMLQLSKWSSVRGMKGVLLGIRTALETWGRLDLKSELNDVIVHPEGSYTELEHLLMRLGLVTEIRPHASSQYDEDALWETMGMEEEAQDKARRHWGQEKSDGSSVERKRKRAGAAAGSSPGEADEGGAVSGGGVVLGDILTVASQVKKAGLSTDEVKTSDEAKARTTTASAAAITAAVAAAAAAAAAGGDALLAPELVGAFKKTGAATAESLKVTAELMGTVGAAGPGAGVGGTTGTGNNNSNSNSSSARNKKQYWAAGTGYGHSGAGEKWDVDAYLAAQREQDRLKEDLLKEIAYLMRSDERKRFPEEVPMAASPPSSQPVKTINALDADDGSAAAAAASDETVNGGESYGSIGKGKGKEGAGKVGAGAWGVAATAASGAAARAGDAAAGAGQADGELGGRVDSSGRRRKRLTLSQEEFRVDSVNSSLRVLEESCLIPFLQQLLENDSLLDVDRHASLYTSVLKLVRCIASWRSLRPLLCPMKGQAPGKSLYRLLSRLGDRAKVYRSTTSKGTGGKKGKADGRAESAKSGTGRAGAGNSAEARLDDPASCGGKNASSGSGGEAGAGSGAAAGNAEADHGALTDLLLDAVREVEDVVDASFVEELERASITRGHVETSLMAVAGGGADGAVRGRGRGASAGGRGGGDQGVEVEEEIEGEEDWRRYRQCMGPLQYLELEDLVSFHYRSESGTTAFRGNPQRVKRLGQEHADLSQSLPLSLSSSVFVRTHEDQMDWMQVIISGPDDTPYSAGLFAFDIFFPHNYPQSPPKVKLMTTGGGHHRFNPNLYADGKVCLSLLGTWDGDKGESWNASTSTLLQVLVSIQSLIFVPEPFFNEPGYERQLGTPQGNSLSWDYNAKQREGTVRLAMLEMLRKPPPGFEGVVRGHFYLRRKYLVHLMDRFVREAKERLEGSIHSSMIEDLAIQLKEELATLSPPASLQA